MHLFFEFAILIAIGLFIGGVAAAQHFSAVGQPTWLYLLRFRVRSRRDKRRTDRIWRDAARRSEQAWAQIEGRR